MVLFYIVEGKICNEVIELVKEELKIFVLEYEIWKKCN